MLDAVFAAYLNSVIACDSRLATPVDSAIAEPKAKVERQICDFLAKSYEHVRLINVKVAAKDVEEAEAQDLYEPFVERPLAGRVKITWLVKSDTGKIKQLNAVYELEAFNRVPVFNKSLPANHALSEGDIEYRLVNIAPYLGLKNVYQGPVTGKMLLKKVIKGNYVFVESLVDSALIKTNDEISLVVKSGGLSVSTLAVALENGYQVKAPIKVRIKETGAVMSANIQSEKLAYVEI